MKHVVGLNESNTIEQTMPPTLDPDMAEKAHHLGTYRARIKCQKRATSPALGLDTAVEAGQRGKVRENDGEVGKII